MPKASQTSYILQFLWRDLTNCYDIVHLYYTSAASVEVKFVVACVFETIKLFQEHVCWSVMEGLQILLRSRRVISGIRHTQ